MHPNYYEGIIQIRGTNDNKVSEIVEEVIAIFRKTRHFIAKMEEVRGGIDLYSSSNKLSRKIGRILYKRHGGELKESERLFSKDKQTQKEMFRVNVLFRIPEFTKGDVVLLKNKLIKITSYSKDVIKGDDLDNNQRVNFKLTTELKNTIKRFDKPHKIRVALLKPKPQILDPETYQMIVLSNAKGDLRVGQKVKVIFHGNSAYVV